MTCMHLACSFFYFIRKLRCNIVVAGNNCKAIFKHALRRQAQVMPFLLLAHKNQPHLVKLLSVFSAGCLCINPCCIDAAVSQYVSQFYNIFLNPIKTLCKQMAQVMRKYLVFLNICLPAKFLHLPPNIAAVNHLS